MNQMKHRPSVYLFAKKGRNKPINFFGNLKLNDLSFVYYTNSGNRETENIDSIRKGRDL